jgi:hypothetical protein
MATFKVYATQMIHYVATIEADSLEAAEEMADDIEYDEFEEYDLDWQTNEIEEVKNAG